MGVSSKLRAHAGAAPACSARPRRSRRTVSDRVQEAVLALGCHHGTLVDHRERPWASITFSGARHEMALLFAGAEAVAAGETFIAALDEHEFAIPRHFVAEAVIDEVEHRVLPAPRLLVRCTLLVLEDA